MTAGVECAVLGCGVIGLSTAIRLMQKGMKVTLYASAQPPETTSNIACALFLPLWVDPDAENVELSGQTLEWSRRSWQCFSLLESEKACGIRLIKNYELVSNKNESDHIREFFSEVSRVYDPRNESITVSTQKEIVIFDTYLVETPSYMSYLFETCKKLGCNFVERKFLFIEEIFELNENIIFNCIGLSAGKVFGDINVFPARGQLSLFALPEILTCNFSYGDNELCFIPRSDYLIVGSLYETEYDIETADEATHQRLMELLHHRGAISAETAAILTYLSGTAPVKLIAGLRPARKGGVRLEREVISGKIVVHNYGHGGSGITLSWGTVESAIALLDGAIDLR